MVPIYINDSSHFDSNNLIPFFRDLLVRSVSFSTLSIEGCILKGWFHSLGKHLDFKSVRLFLYNDGIGSFITRHIYGDRELWKDFDASGLRREFTSYKKLHFVKVRHVRENGHYLVLGYFGFYTENYVTKQLLESLDVLGFLYGNYIVRRLVRGKMEQSSNLLSKIYSLVSSRELPGTKILGLLANLRKLSGFNYGVFCTIQQREVYPEYVASTRSECFLQKSHKWILNSTLYSNLQNAHGFYSCNMSELPNRISTFFLFKDNRNPKGFITTFYPVFVDGDLIGLWVVSFSRNNPFDNFSINGLLDDIYPMIHDNYKYLFQRRFKTMVINPVFNGRDTRIIPNSVFVIMPFSEDWSDDVWNMVLKPAIVEMGLNPVRADDLYGSNVMEDIWNGILKSALVICDTTGRNPNVFYELGIAHTLGKKVLLLSQNVDDIPFDLRTYRHIQYEVSISGAAQLKEKINEHIANALSTLNI